MNSIDYYERVGAFLAKYPDPRRAESQSESDFYRLFMVPGFGHCFGGVRPINFGQLGAVTAEGRGDPERDILAALVQRVESGVAPERLVGVGHAPTDPSKQLSRPFYPYPAVTRYNGEGDPNDAVSFSAVKP
jgi:feruloyl esterase